MALRPALKPLRLEVEGCSSPLPFASSAQMLDSPRVHFPPTPALTSIALTHSPHIYDRAPIHVTPNNCALPERGARTYFSTEATSPPCAKESYFHQRREGRIHSMQGWFGETQSLSFVAHDLCSGPSTSPALHCISAPEYYSSSEDSEASSDGMNTPSSPNGPSNMAGAQVSVHLRTISSSAPSRSSYTAEMMSAQGYNDAVDAINMHHAELSTTFSLLPPGAGSKPKGAKKKVKESRLQAGESYRRTTCDTAFGLTPDLEGCLGGF